MFGQASDGNLVGIVTDTTGAALTGATVNLENPATGNKLTTVSGTDGTYRFNNIPVGTWNLSATQPGFATSTALNLRIESNRTGTVNLTLEVGAVTTMVEVQDTAVIIDTTTANLSNTYNTRAAELLPITGFGSGSTNLGVINLSLLSAGVTSSGGAGYGTGPSIGGQRPTNNNFMIDGMDNNHRSVTGPSTTVPNEAVAEFSLQQNQFGAEFGQSSGGQFNTILKSGTNEFHGSVYEYFQNKHLSAIDESFKRGKRPEDIVAPRFDQNRFGGTLGGRIIPNKWFFFGNYEKTVLGQASTPAGAVSAPTAQGIQILEGLQGQGMVNAQNLANFRKFVPVAPSAARTVPVAGQEIPIGIIAVAGPSFSNFDTYLITSDFNISERDQIRARYIYNKSDTINTTSVTLPEFFTPVKLSYHFATLSHYHTFAPTVTNELRAGYLRRVDDRPVGEQAWAGADVLPNVQFQDLALTIGPNSSYPQGNRNNTFSLVENLNWTTGRHTLKFGYDGRKLNSTSIFVQRVRGDYIYNTFDRFLRDITPEFAERSVGGFPFVGNNLSHALFANDEWRIRQNLTLTLGLRYEYIGVPTGSKQQALNAIANVPGLIEFNEPKATTKDFAPRVGLAWSPGQDGKTSIRAGFGMAYDQVYQNLGGNTLPPQFFTTIQAHVDQPGAPNFLQTGGISGAPRPVTSAARARQLTASYVTDQVRPYSVTWNFGINRVFGEDYGVEVRYVGTRGVHLPMQIILNRPAGVTPERSLPTFLERPSQAALDALTLTRNDLQPGSVGNAYTLAGFTNGITTFLPQGNSSYHGLATQVNKRFSRGLQFVGAYTWSHNIDDSTAALNSTVLTPRRPQDFLDLRAERASSALDRRHRFTFAPVYETPWFKDSNNWAAKNLLSNWIITGIYIVETGAWATARSGIDSNLNGDPAADRTVINPAGDPRRGSGVQALTNSAGAIVGYLAEDPTARYIVAGAGVYPNAGRNTIRLPGINNLDLTAGKRFNFTERVNVQFRAEFYNALNRPQYTAGVPNAANLRTRVGGAETTMLIPGFVRNAGAALQTNSAFLAPDLAFQSNARTGQLVLKLEF
ncbi:MAG TPA: TonB-dependent receptor [Bryobacteraceae bacterium]|nr:TonB-dependent receptor [Bryobacteraceae bacterium]